MRLVRSDLDVTDNLHSGQRTAGAGLIFGSRPTINITLISRTIHNQYFLEILFLLFMENKQKRAQRCAFVCV